MINIKNLNKKFQENKNSSFTALKDINLTIKDGEFVVLKGVSGSGKSTLLSIIGATMKPTSGEVEVDGENIVSYSDFHAANYRNKKVGFVTQFFYLFDELSTKENVSIPLIATNFCNKKAQDTIDHALQIANISHKADQRVKTLSGGEKQRCVIARALVNSPKIIICDEPTANLDHTNSIKFIEIIMKLKKMKKTVIIATHDPLFEELKCVDRVVNIKEGSLE
jgi:putative ABC transport system ATP-binding protein